MLLIKTMFVIEEYLDERGKRPFRIWLDKLDKKIQSRIIARISRFRYGNFCDYKKVTKNIFEARFFSELDTGFTLHKWKEK